MGAEIEKLVLDFVGAAYGALRAAVAALGVPSHVVAPAVWKRHWRLSADKEQAQCES